MKIFIFIVVVALTGFLEYQLFKLDSENKRLKFIISKCRSTLNAIPCNKDLMHEYQIELEMDSASVYDNGRFVGSYCYPKTPVNKWTGIDLIFANDNR